MPSYEQIKAAQQNKPAGEEAGDNGSHEWKLKGLKSLRKLVERLVKHSGDLTKPSSFMAAAKHFLQTAPASSAGWLVLLIGKHVARFCQCTEPRHVGCQLSKRSRSGSERSSINLLTKRAPSAPLMTR